MKFKGKLTKITLVLILIGIFILINQNVFAEVSQGDGLTNNYLDSGDNKWFQDFLGKVLRIGGGALSTPIARLLQFFAAFLFTTIYIIAAPMCNNMFPYPGDIIFNKIPIFDPNIFNPPSNSGSHIVSPADAINSTIANLYKTGFTIGISIFVIAALVVGIKLAFSSIASEKAHYKQSVTNWFVGIILLVTTHYVIIAMFTVNENIVKAIAIEAEGIDFDGIEIPSFKPISPISKNISNIITGTEDFINLFLSDDKEVDFTIGEQKGYKGLINLYTRSALIDANLVSTIVLIIMLGQTATLIFLYLKRFINVIILILIAPLIVAFDVVKKTFA